ncbi:hypothetical protein AX777_21395 [Sphingobium yanoikuyae]|jgi:hypothetical protein|uniref:Uncharacterized protein n=1 Tax=Sphingobium yanoikuyae TaxID=13690 RepID=A0A177JKN0_SPHYA|nr:hypothetical protein [Sphingobium yanoikuyae]OAH41869.1 hypothetical protein AX777_21395 [Sphingobium yanoikuyae]
MQRSLTDQDNAEPANELVWWREGIPAVCSIRFGSHRFPFRAGFFPVLRAASEDGAGGRSLSPAFGAHNFQTISHEDASA